MKCKPHDNRQYWKIIYYYPELFTIISLAILNGYENIYNVQFFVMDFLEELQNVGLINEQGNCPSKNTFYRVMYIVPWEEFEDLSQSIFNHLPQKYQNALINNEMSTFSIDGKFIIGNRDIGLDGKVEKLGIDIVSIRNNRTNIVINQLAVIPKDGKKYCEKYVMRELAHNLKPGSILSADAIACDHKTLKTFNDLQIIYVVSLKKNQKNLLKNVEEVFEFDDIKHRKPDLELEPIYQGGKWIIRSYKIVSDSDNDWQKYIFLNKNKGNIRSVVQETKKIIDRNGNIKKEIAYLVSNSIDIKKIAQGRREHWTIESLHWLLDMVFNEDRCILKNVNATITMNIFRKLALLLLNLPIFNVYKIKNNPMSTKQKQRSSMAMHLKPCTQPLI